MPCWGVRVEAWRTRRHARVGPVQRRCRGSAHAVTAALTRVCLQWPSQLSAARRIAWQHEPVQTRNFARGFRESLEGRPGYSAAGLPYAVDDRRMVTLQVGAQRAWNRASARTCFTVGAGSARSQTPRARAQTRTALLQKYMLKTQRLTNRTPFAVCEMARLATTRGMLQALCHPQQRHPLL